EIKIAPATFTWLGTTSGNWNDATNWSHDTGSNTVPTNPADLIVFPSAASNKTSVNDLVGTTFDSINIQGSGYSLSGSALTLNSGLSDTGAGASSTYDIA